MVPKERVVYITTDKTIEGAIDIISKTPYSAFPICKTSLGDTMGIIYAKDTLKYDKTTPVLNILTPILKVKSTQKADELLEEMQTKKIYAAIVIDKDNKILGLALIEHVIEKIVGEIKCL